MSNPVLISAHDVLDANQNTSPSALSHADFGESIAECFERRLGSFADRIAVDSETGQLTYAELNRIANGIAQALLHRCESSEPVALLLEHGLPAILGVLGTLKAGRIYVPLDPSFPLARNQYILQDSQATLLVTNNRNLALTKSFASCPEILNLDEIPAVTDLNPGVQISPDALAYILSTSGSTGKPKGVVQSHRNVLSVVSRHTTSLAIAPEDRLSLFPSYSVTAWVANTFGALLNGACLCPFDLKERGVNPIAQWLAEREITIYRSVPTVFRHFVATLTGSEQFPKLRLIRLGGEPLTRRDVELYRAHFSDHCVLINGYGSSEISNVWEYRIDKSTPISADLIPIGWAIDDTGFELVDDEGKPVTGRTVGEIVIRSRYLSPGYWRRPELTAAVFQDEGNGERSYHTGDVGYCLPDGCLVHVGRKDFQVKIRGYRVETSEIEAVLLAIEQVREAAVVARDDGNGDKQLAAYVVARTESGLTGSELRRLLKQRLPEHMVPAAFVFLDALPLTPNGKLDRTALPAPTAIGSPASFVEPRTATEKALVAIFAEVLNLHRVGVHDDFFALGGHSLTAGQVIARVRQSLHVELAIPTLFGNPTVRALAAELDRVEKGGVETLRKLTARTRTSPCPTSFSQQRLWFLHQLERELAAYNIADGVRISGVLNVAALETALRRIVDRHEVLRTTFVAVDGVPQQVIADARPFQLPVVDVSQHARPEEEAMRLARERASKPFDLAQDLMLRATLFRLAPQEHLLVTVVQHIAFDAWSQEIFFHELLALYSALTSGEPDGLPELPAQYSEFAEWQRRNFAGEHFEKKLSYWRQKLAGAPASLELPTDRARPAAQTFNGAVECLTLPKQLADSLAALGREQGATLFMSLLAALAAVLSRYSGQDDLVIGSPVAGRNLPELRELIGFFVNSLPLRLDGSGDPSFRELLARVRKTAVEAYEHQDVPFEKLVDELQPERDLARNPLFQVMFALQNVPHHSDQVSGIEVRRFKIETGHAKLDIFLSAEETADGLHLRAEYNTDLFDSDTLRRMLSNFKTFLEAAVASPDRSTSVLPLLSPSEAHHVLVQWNDTRAEYPREFGVHQLFETQALRNPDAMAAIHGNQSLTYKELNGAANRLAHYLRKRGVKSESLVAICLERSLQVLVSMLGVLKAGGAYVPLDPAYPKDRLDFVLDDAGVTAVLTQQSLADQVRGDGRRLICLDTDWPRIAREPDEDLQAQGRAENLAYVIYTSGSTGKPKGVQIEHRALTNFLTSVADKPGISAADRLLAVTTISFDIAGLELFLPLISGARVIIASREEAADPAELISLMRKSAATMMQATPATWRMLLDVGWEGKHGIKALCGGEALTGELANRLRQRCGSVWNMYGPTETTIWSAVQHVRGEQSGIVPIGYPIANTQLYVLGAKLQPLPIGVPGDLYIGGDGLARGYLNRPELSAEKFIANPFSPQTRLYKTGDRARYRQDGAVDFLGRADFQVKIRGFRIELGEIESVLRTCPGVQEAVVVAHGEDANKRLVAYVVPEQGQGTDERLLRESLQLKLPDYMLPSVYVMLREFPLTPNGKVDRRALPAPASSAFEVRGNFVAPRDEVEIEIAQLWQTLLERAPIGIYDNFFELGGHSLLATQFLARLRNAFQVQVPLRSFFQEPTVSGIAKALEEVLLTESEDVRSV